MKRPFVKAVLALVLIAPGWFSAGAAAHGISGNGSYVTVSSSVAPAEAGRPFKQVLAKAASMVRARYGTYQFYTAEGKPRNSTGTTTGSLQQWRFVFNVPRSASCASAGTATVTYNIGAFAGPSLRCNPLVGVRTIHLPLHRTLWNALHLLREAGFTGAFTGVSVHFVLYPGVTEPTYTFSLVRPTQQVSVGIATGSVRKGG